MKTVTKGTVIEILGNVFACLVMPTKMIVQSVDVSTMCIFIGLHSNHVLHLKALITG